MRFGILDKNSLLVERMGEEKKEKQNQNKETTTMKLVPRHEKTQEAKSGRRNKRFRHDAV